MSRGLRALQAKSGAFIGCSEDIFVLIVIAAAMIFSKRLQNLGPASFF